MSGIGDILAQLNALLTPTEQLPGEQHPSGIFLSPSLTAARPQAPATGGGSSSGGSGGVGSYLQNPSTLKNALSAISSLFSPSLAAYASGAPADSAVASALGSVGSQTAPTAASIQASNDAALAASDGGAAGAGAGLLGMGGIASGAAANGAVTGALGSVGAQTAGESAAIQAANDAALGGSSAGATAAPSALSSAGYAMAGPAAFAAMYGLGNELNAMFTGQNNNYSIGQINGMLNQARQGESVLPPSMANGPAGSLNAVNPNGSVNQPLMNALTNLNQLQLGDFGQATPYVQQQLAGMGYSPALSVLQGKTVPSNGMAAGPGQVQLLKRF